MNQLIHDGWTSRFKSLTGQTTEDSWDTITATILHRTPSLDAVRALYPRHAAFPAGIGFYVSGAEVKPSALPGVCQAQVQLVGAFAAKLKATGAASAHSESPSNILIPSLGSAVFEKTDILICEPTYEILAVDAVRPDTLRVGQQAIGPYGGGAFPQPPANPFNFTAADAVANRTVHWPWGWCFIGVEWEQIGALYLKRYYYTYRHLVTA